MFNNLAFIPPLYQIHCLNCPVDSESWKWMSKPSQNPQKELLELCKKDPPNSSQWLLIFNNVYKTRVEAKNSPLECIL